VAGGAGLLAWPGGAAAAAALAGPRTAKRPVLVGSANALRALDAGMEVLAKGGDTLDAALAAVRIVEDDPADDSVGYGGLPNEEGVVELDASVMHGPTHRAGAVASLQRIKNPSLVARDVMVHTNHLLLVGEGALRFARRMGYEETNLLTEESRKAWLLWRKALNKGDNWIPTPEEEKSAAYRKLLETQGTVHVSAVDAAGHVSGCTSTSGLSWKLPGRVGDSPLIGCGLYADDDVGSAGATGRGESCILHNGSFLVVEGMRRGLEPKEACLEALRRVVKKSEPRLLGGGGRPLFDLKMYAVRKDGEHGGAGLFQGNQYAVHDGEARRVAGAWLFDK
jgi:N4-(beta-N-acetylglucosaminyl)-L-asparaginase